jgi:hypothetical protein
VINLAQHAAEIRPTIALVAPLHFHSSRTRLVHATSHTFSTREAKPAYVLKVPMILAQENAPVRTRGKLITY